MKTQPASRSSTPSSNQLPWHSRLAEATLVTCFPYSVIAIISGILLGILGLFTAPLYLSTSLTSWLMTIPETLIFGGLGGIALIPISIGLDSYLSHQRHNRDDDSSSDEYDDAFPQDDEAGDDLSRSDDDFSSSDDDFSGSDDELSSSDDNFSGSDDELSSSDDELSGSDDDFSSSDDDFSSSDDDFSSSDDDFSSSDNDLSSPDDELSNSDEDE